MLPQLLTIVSNCGNLIFYSRNTFSKTKTITPLRSLTLAHPLKTIYNISMPENPNILHWEQKPDPQKSAHEATNTPLISLERGLAPDARRRYPNIFHWGDDPAPKRTAQASENVAKMKHKGRALSALLGIALLKGAIEYPVRITNYAIEQLDALDKVTRGLPFGGLAINPIDTNAYFAAYKKIAGAYAEKRLIKKK